MMDDNLSFYSKNTHSLVAQYDSVSFENVHSDWLKFVPKNGTVLDIGAGSGRDARYLSEQGLKTFAVEPAYTLLQAAESKSLKHDIAWYQDDLPNLHKIKQLDTYFDLILVSGVWMHLTIEERALSIGTLVSLLNVGGRLVITLRHGEFSDGRIAYPLSASEVCELGEQCDLSVLLKTDLSDDKLGRGNVAWQTVVMVK
jgi:SAM-dependent methyltransferase